MNERILNSETKQDRIVFPNALNDHDTLFGGIAMQWMDEVAYITAIRFTKNKMVTVAAEKIQFLFPIEAGAIVEVVGKVEKVGSVKIIIQVEILAQDMITGIITTATRAMFTFATVDEANRPIPIEEKLFTEKVFQDR
jgi:acyl-CoA hydrolase